MWVFTIEFAIFMYAHMIVKEDDITKIHCYQISEDEVKKSLIAIANGPFNSWQSKREHSHLKPSWLPQLGFLL